MFLDLSFPSPISLPEHGAAAAAVVVAVVAVVVAQVVIRRLCFRYTYSSTSTELGATKVWD